MLDEDAFVSLFTVWKIHVAISYTIRESLHATPIGTSYTSSNQFMPIPPPVLLVCILHLECMNGIKEHIYLKCHSELQDSTTATTYILFSDFKFLFYLDNVQNSKTKNRKALSRLRVSSYRLAIEIGRWHKPNVIPRHERKIPVCSKLEEEFHFLLECPLYSDLRKTYIN